MKDHRPPALPLLAREAASFAVMRMLARFGPAVALPQTGAKRLILVIPGFMAGDETTTRLRRSLENAGHETYGWGLGRNRGVTADLLDRIDRRVVSIQAKSDASGPAVIIGWSLGGLLAREYAKHAPDKVAQVITLGSPFSGDIRGNNAWRVYELIAGHKVDEPPYETALNEKPIMPTTAFWSRRDGVVSPASARGETGEADEQIELDCTHMAFISKPSVIAAIAGAIANESSAR
ncbi:MAG: alpha/beta fold hydrolase [Sphingorhabdus sp.]